MASASQTASDYPHPEAGTPSSNVSLIRGGPFYRAQQATHLIAPGRWNLGRRITFAVAVGWLPLVLMTVLFHPPALRNLLTDYRVAARLLIAVPVLVARAGTNGIAIPFDRAIIYGRSRFSDRRNWRGSIPS
jgi:hypothetical protein